VKKLDDIYDIIKDDMMLHPHRHRKAIKGSNQRLRREKLHCVPSHGFVVFRFNFLSRVNLANKYTNQQRKKK